MNSRISEEFKMCFRYREMENCTVVVAVVVVMVAVNRLLHSTYYAPGTFYQYYLI